jgi:tRNA (adenine22-N1)-methyltransferase
VRLSARLRGLLELVPETGAVADVGSGHGMLAAALAARGRRVIATERTPRTAAALRADLMARTADVEVRRGEGLSPLAPGEVEVVVMAGMGGARIVRILDRASWLPRWLVLQPIQDPSATGEWIAARGFASSSVEMVDRGRRYRAWRVDTRRA